MKTISGKVEKVNTYTTNNGKPAYFVEVGGLSFSGFGEPVIVAGDSVTISYESVQRGDKIYHNIKNISIAAAEAIVQPIGKFTGPSHVSATPQNVQIARMNSLSHANALCIAYLQDKENRDMADTDKIISFVKHVAEQYAAWILE